MITEKRVLEVTSNLGGEQVGMTIDDSALAHIMSVLTDLYSDPELAVIREYSTNAFDAHVEDGVTRPIEIQTPTQMSPYFKVRDYGAGLDANDIREIYSRYGTSTKRESNDVVGMLGLGCKSALTYTDQFTVTGIKNGVCTQVSVSRDEDGAGSMTIVDETPTTEPSGVEIVVPVKSYNQFESKSRTFFRFWNEGTVLVNGEAPARIDGLWVTEKLLLTSDSMDMIVMGNVAYPFDNPGRYDRGADKRHIVAFVDIGEVNFTPSREALQLNAKTKATIERVVAECKRERIKAINKTVDAAANKVEALKIVSEAVQFGVERHEINRYKGVTVPEFVEQTRTDGQPMPEPWTQVARDKAYRGKQFHHVRKIYTTHFNEILWLTGYDEPTFTPTKRAKLVQWADTQGVELPQTIMLVDKHPLPDWVDPSTIYNWADVKAQKITKEKVERQDGRPTGSYTAWVAGGYEQDILAADIPMSDPIFYTTQKDDRQALRSIKQIFPTATLVYFGANRENKFKRDFPAAQEANEALVSYAATWYKGLSKAESMDLALNEHGHGDLLKQFDVDDFDDPMLKLAVRQARALSKSTTLAIYQSTIRFIAGRVSQPDQIEEKYPLLTGIYSYGRMPETTKQHATLYANAAYAAEMESV